MIALAAPLALAFALSSPADNRALDVGRTLQGVDRLRAEARYADAAAELRGLTDRWYSSGIGGPGFDTEAARIHELLRLMVALEEVSQHADDDPAAARRWLALVVDPARPAGHTAEQARALTALAKHDAVVRAILDAAFPARIVVDVDGETPDPNLQAFPFENAIVEMSNDALPVVRGAGASTLRVRLVLAENNSHNSLIEGTSMKSYAVNMSAVLEGADGVALSKIATTTSVLGINPGYAARMGMARCAQVLYAQLVDDIAKRAAVSSP